ncbi:MAG: hypothetical protein A4E40_01031 [Methanoregulaceae archaeon PtaU1.Bin059]|nr:MAG: hypothetical protein A4E40_01031 [Methanoregulaceae archaeon PtaU1.Bin059]
MRLSCRLVNVLSIRLFSIYFPSRSCAKKYVSSHWLQSEAVPSSETRSFSTIRTVRSTPSDASLDSICAMAGIITSCMPAKIAVPMASTRMRIAKITFLRMCMRLFNLPWSSVVQ